MTGRGGDVEADLEITVDDGTGVTTTAWLTGSVDPAGWGVLARAAARSRPGGWGPAVLLTATAAVGAAVLCWLLCRSAVIRPGGGS